ncbi:MAG: hypothetical protein IBX61_09710 [Thermoleophilia bacterium]|nr:hypothetical protein [Thermoleophilia bacterium]
MKSHGWLIKLMMGLLASVFLWAAPTAVAQAEPTPDFEVRLFCEDAYWASYSDYTDRVLTVPYNIGNVGTAPVYNVTLQAASATNSVNSITGIPIWMGDLEAGIWNSLSFKWYVPFGVTSFVSTLTVCFDCDPNICVGEVDADDGGSPDPLFNGGINIKPGSCPNSINLDSSGRVAVAVYSFDDFDAQDIIAGTVLFAGAAPVKWGPEDVDGDGRLDMVYHFERENLELQPGDNRACLSAQLSDGGSFRSCDMVRLLD